MSLRSPFPVSCFMILSADGSKKHGKLRNNGTLNTHIWWLNNYYAHIFWG
jgi:hypothetical protein